MYEQARKDLEMKNCTFKPEIGTKSKKIISNQRKQDGLSRSYENLHKKQQKQIERTQKLMEEKEARLLEGCTFSPEVPKSFISATPVTQ
jgi:hypothetical protein